MADVTQAQVDDLAAEALSLVPSAKKKDLEDDIKGRANYSLDRQASFLRGVIGAFEETDIAKYRPEPVHVIGSNGVVKKTASTNPWSASAWNVSEQGRICRTLGEAKGASMAKSAGCVLGGTKPNPFFN